MSNLPKTLISISWTSVPSTLEAVHWYRPASVVKRERITYTDPLASNTVSSLRHVILGEGTPVALHLTDKELRVTVVTLDPTSTVNEPLSKSLRDLETAEIFGETVSVNKEYN